MFTLWISYIFWELAVHIETIVVMTSKLCLLIQPFILLLNVSDNTGTTKGDMEMQ